jgi:peptide/nickel transport system substrate-binding protein
MDGKRGVRRFGLKKRSKTIKKHARRIEDVTTRHAHRFLISRWDKIREIRLHIIVWLGSVGVLIAIVGIQMTWFQQSYITKAPVGGGTYAEAIKGPIQTLNPLYATTPAELAASHLLFSSLYSTDTTGHLRGDVATTMKNEGDKVFTVKLRHDVRWHDGQPLTAQDVVYTVGLMKSQAVRSVMSASWQGVNAQRIDDYTVQFSLPAAYAAFPQALTFSILPVHIVKNINQSSLREAPFSTAPIGSGPFSLRLLQVISQTGGRKIVHLDPNSDYFAGRPRVEHLQLHVYKDDDSMAMALKTGEVTAAAGTGSDVVAGLDTNRYDVDLKPIDDGVYAIFNTTQETLKDQAVRKALQLATDTNAIRDQIYGHPNQLYLPFIPSQVANSQSIPAPATNSAAAAKQLDAAGWTLHDGVRMKGTEKLRLRVVIRKNTDYEIALQALAKQWQKIGVQVDSQVFDTSDPTRSFTNDILQRRDYDVLLDELVIGGDPDVFVYWHSKGILNFSNYSNETSDDDLSSARTNSNAALRAVKYVAFAKQWLSDVPAIGLYQPNMIYVHTKATSALQPDETVVSIDDHYANVRYWTANQGTVYKTP